MPSPPTPQAPSFLCQLLKLTGVALADFFHWPQGGKPLPETTPLHEAARKNDITELSRLLRAGANPNVQDVNLNTPLHMATSQQASLLLLRAGADPNALNAGWRAPLDYASRKQRRVLVEHGANPAPPPPRIHGVGGA